MEDGQPNTTQQLATIQQDFIDAALAHPDNNAIWTDSGEITYSDLLCRCNLFAQWLIDNNQQGFMLSGMISE